MKTVNSFVAIVTLISFINQARCGCERPLEVRGVEDYCWNKHVEVGEKIQQVEKKVVNFAKRKLGMDVEEPSQPQKCEYYYCIFQEMKLLNPTYDVPCIDRTSKWVKKNVIYDQALIILDRIQMCTGELANATMSGGYFLAGNVGKTPDDQIKDDSSEPQSKCEISKQYMECLSVADKEEECPIFQYP